MSAKYTLLSAKNKTNFIIFVESVNGLSGQLLMNSPDGSVNILSAGSTISLSVSQYQSITSSSQALSQNKNYHVINNTGTPTALTLPIACSINSMINIALSGTGLFTIFQNTGQQISYGEIVTTLGVAGSVSAQNKNSFISLLCTNDNLSWNVIQSVGNFQFF